MMKRAEIAIHFPVYFEDNGEDDLKDQAIEAAWYLLEPPLFEANIEVVGEVHDSE